MGGQAEAVRVFNEMPKLYRAKSIPWNALMMAHNRSGEFAKSIALFEQMKQESVAADAVTYSLVLSTCTQEQNIELGRKLHAQVTASNDTTLLKPFQ